MDITVTLPQLEYSLDKLHDTVLEATVLNSNVDKPIHSQCAYIESLLSQYGKDIVDTRLIGLISKYLNIFESQRPHNNDIANMLDNFTRILNNIDMKIDNIDETITPKKVRFSDNVGMSSPLRIEQSFEPYHDNYDIDDNHEEEDFNALPSVSESPLDFNQQNSALQKQDIQLDSLSRSMEWTHSLSRQMNDEISSQNETVLIDLEANIDHNQRNLNRIMNHRILKDSDRDNNTNDHICMIILVLILILLFLLIIF